MVTFAKSMLTNVAMNKRLQQFIFAENISQSSFADTLGVARASVSHILSGRNKPGFDFIESLTKAYPALNIEWLITGEGKMYKTAKIVDLGPQEPDLFSAAQEETTVLSPAVPSPAPETALPLPAVTETAAPRREPIPEAKNAGKIDINTLGKHFQTSANQKEISKIIVFFSDGSFQEIAA